MNLLSHFRLISQIFDTGFRRLSRSSLFPSHHSLRPRFPQNNGRLGSRQLHPTKRRTWESLWRRQAASEELQGDTILELRPFAFFLFTSVLLCTSVFFFHLRFAFLFAFNFFDLRFLFFVCDLFFFNLRFLFFVCVFFFLICNSFFCLRFLFLFVFNPSAPPY